MCFPQMQMVVEVVVQASAARSAEDVELPSAVTTGVFSRAGLDRPAPAPRLLATVRNPQRSGVGKARAA